jgi:hypothetical protein
MWSTVDDVLAPALQWLGVAALAVHLRPGRTPTASPLGVGRAALYVVASWAVAFGIPTIGGIRYLLRPGTASFVDTGPHLLSEFLRDYLPRCLFAGLLVVAAARRVGTSPRAAGLAWPERTGGRGRRELAGLTLLCLFGLLGSGSVSDVVPDSPNPWDRELTPGSHPWFIVDQVLSSARAAVGEELVVLAVPVLLLRAARVPTRWIVVAVLALRLSFHLYYGWFSLHVLLWAALFAGLYMVRGWLWPQVIAHFLLDVINGALGPQQVQWPWQAAWTLALGVPVVFLLGVRFQLERARHSGFARWVAAGGRDQLQAAVASVVAPRRVEVVTKRWRPMVGETRLLPDGTYQVRVGGGVQHLSRDELAAVAARAAAEIRLGQPDTRRGEVRAQRRSSILGLAALLTLTVVALGVVAPHRGAAAAGVVWVAGALLLLGCRYRADAAAAQRTRTRTVAADLVAAAMDGEGGIVGVLQRLHELEEPSDEWLSGRGLSHRLPAGARIAAVRSASAQAR